MLRTPRSVTPGPQVKARALGGRRTSPSLLAAGRDALVEAWSNERAEAPAARAGGNVAGEWRNRERAHILSQPMAVLHVRTHVAVLGSALRRRGSGVSAFVAMPTPDDLRAILHDDAKEAAR